MHDALRVAEIVLEIAQHASGTTKRARKDLLALATTCQLFLDPALNELWCKLDSIDGLLRCFPPGVFEFTEAEYNTTISVSRAIRASDWARPLFYARRVKHLQFIGINSIGGHELHVLRHLALSLPVPMLFPHVATLDWRPNLGQSDSNEDTFQQMLLFLGPQLHKLLIHVDAARCLSVLPALTRLSPALRSVDIRQRGMSVSLQNGGFSDPISEFVISLKRLQSLNVPSLTWSALLYLSELPELKTLTFGTLTAPPPPPLANLSPGFSALEGLDLGVALLPVAANFLKLFAPAPLRMFTITLQQCPAPSDALTFLTALSKLRAHTTLQEFSYVIDRNDSESDQHNCTQSCRATNDLLRRLYSFASFSDVTLHIPAGFDLDDSTIVELCRAWPGLASLVLSMDEPPSDAPGGTTFTPPMTLNALASIATLCPDLNFLHITLDARLVPRPSLPKPRSHAGDASGTSKRSARVIHKALSRLFIGFSPIAATHPVARFLSGLFPAAAVAGYHSNIEFANKWERVCAEVPRLAKIREEERAWAAADSDVED
ncbi:hypothetical protein C8F01DRAFT_1237457 [Mycena amicta]|nr:hypothetical protein C8F01DRAFT_1237457 [Mycena amicta]